MESDDDYELLPSASSPVHQQKLKRLKKAIGVPEYSCPKLPNDYPSTPHAYSSQLERLNSDGSVDRDLEESKVGSGPGFIASSGDCGVNTEPDGSKRVEKDGVGAMRVLGFDTVSEELDGRNEACSMQMEAWEEAGDLTEGLDKKRRSSDSFEDKKDKKKKKKKTEDNHGEKLKHSANNKRRAERERQDYLKQLRADSQRLLRETRDAEFKPIPFVQKPISSVLEKIRQRKLEVLMKCSVSIDDNDGFGRELMVDGKHVSLGEDITGSVEKVESEEAFTCLAVTKTSLDASLFRGINDAEKYSTYESIPSSMAMAPEPELAFRAPIDDTQELFPDSDRTDTKDESGNDKADSPSEEVFTPSTLVMNLKLDSAPPDDISSDEEDNDKENADPHLHGSTNLSSPPSGDPMKAFVDVEAEEEDDSDNDLLHFQDHEEEEDDDDDAEELNNMIASEYEEKPIDRERRDELHQQWLEQQDAAGMDSLLQKLNCGSKLRKTASIDREEDGEEKETDNESDDETEDIAPSGDVRVNLKKLKQMIPQMFTDKDDGYVSSDDEETETRLAKQCLFDKSEEQSTFLSPAEDESCREVFSLIKKLNVAAETKRKGRISSFMDTSLIGRNISISSKSSFLGRASNNSVPSSQKHGSGKVRFIFGRDDSNSRTTNSMSEDSSDTIQREIQPPKVGSAKFKGNTQNKNSTFNSASQKSSTSLLEILRRSSVQAEHCVQNTVVQQTESVFAAFKLAKKPIKTEGRV